MDCHFVCDVVTRELISTPFTPSSEELADMFTKFVTPRVFSYLYNKLGMIEILCSSLRGGVRIFGCFAYWVLGILVIL